jgi:hypothetical protein
MGQPDHCPEELRSHAIRLRLDESAFARKLAAARTYPELAAEVDTALNRFGIEPFRVECLRPIDHNPRGDAVTLEPPFYERYGKKQVAAGYYDRVLSYREHVFPLIEAVWNDVERTG